MPTYLPSLKPFKSDGQVIQDTAGEVSRTHKRHSPALHLRCLTRNYLQ